DDIQVFSIPQSIAAGEVAPRPLLPSLRGPVLVLHGERDMRRSVADAEELAACLPSAQLRLLPGGHTPMVDCLPQYLQALHPFLAALAHQPAQA
ncbi:alpha/beta fold hydrolase, partial [Paracidovorax cattleyae]|uniref:alpha/beta fold hydrolase n=1 Tax=Paracidovorax cattleyae TaxID=80868 RepID=UPI0018AF9DC9